MIAALALLLAAAPPPILQLHRERLKPGAEAAYSGIEVEAAGACARLGAPHPYLGLESWNGAREAWWLNAYASDAEVRAVARGYAKNAALSQALAEVGARKKDLVTPLGSTTLRLRPRPGDGGWRLLGARFFVAAERRASNRRLPGAVFAAPGGTFFVLVPVATRQEAQLAARALGRDARVLAIRPDWSLPAPEWVAADPQFWKP